MDTTRKEQILEKLAMAVNPNYLLRQKKRMMKAWSKGKNKKVNRIAGKIEKHMGLPSGRTVDKITPDEVASITAAVRKAMGLSN